MNINIEWYKMLKFIGLTFVSIIFNSGDCDSLFCALISAIISIKFMNLSFIPLSRPDLKLNKNHL